MLSRVASLAIRQSYRATRARRTSPGLQRNKFSTTQLRASTPMAAPTDTQATVEANTSGITPESLSKTLQEKLNASHVDIQDMSGGCGQAFNAIIVSSQFEKKTLLARHRLVNNALKEEIAAIHAWTPKCLTPEQWEKEQAKTE